VETTQLEMKRSTYLRTAEGMVDKCLRESRAMRPAEELDYESLRDKIDSIDRTLGRASMFGRNSTAEPGAVFTRMVAALASARGNMQAAIDRSGITKDHEVARALSASIGSAGGFAVPLEFSSEITQALRPMVAVRKLNPVVLPMDKGNLKIPRIATGGNVSYIGENLTVPQSQTQVFAALQLTAKKLGSLVPISNDFLRYARPAGDTIVKQDILAALASGEDFNLINGNGTAYTPKGLVNWVTPANTITANATVSLANTDSDLGALETALTSANVRMLRPGWIFNPRTLIYLKNLRGTGGDKAYPELDGGMLRGYPYAATTNVPVNLGSGNQSLILLADFSEVVLGECELLIDAAQSVYTDAAGNTISAFTQDQTVIRIISQHDIGMRNQAGIAMLTGVSWIPAAA
jgi:HK97 family phage major capsid protein